MNTGELSTEYAGWPKEKQLLSKFQAMQILGFEKKAKRKHFSVLGFILDWYHDGYGNALASVRHIGDELKARDPERVGLYTGTIHSALGDLVAWGYLHQEKGSGRKSSRYFPNWEKFSVRDSMNTNSVRETPNASVRETPNATAVSIRDSLNEDPSTGPDLLIRGHVDVDKSSFAHGFGLAASPREEDWFQDAFRAYGEHGDPEAGRVVWDALAPEAELAAHIASQAESWKRSAKPGQGRMPFEKWLSEKRYGAPKSKPSVKVPRRKGYTTRDVTIIDCIELKAGWNLEVDFNDAEPDERKTGTLRVTIDEHEAMEDSLGFGFIGDRVWLFVNQDDHYQFARRG